MAQNIVNAIVSKTELAELYGVSIQAISKRIERYEKRYGLKLIDGKVKLADFVRASEKSHKEINTGKLNEAIKAIKLEQEKYKLEIMKGKYISVEEVAKQFEEIALKVKTTLLSWLDKLPPLLEKKTKRQIAKILNEQIKEVLERLYEYSKE